MYYSKEKLSEKTCEKFLKILKVSKEDVVCVVCESAPFGGVGNGLILTTSELIYRSSRGRFFAEVERYPLTSISSIYIEKGNRFSFDHIKIGLSGIGNKEFFVISNGLQSFFDDFISLRDSNNSKKSSDSGTNEDIEQLLKKLYNLKTQGILTEEEFSQKKKQLLGL